MKFSHSLLFSTVPEWQPYYVAYDSLKSKIYGLEKEWATQQNQKKALNQSTRPENQTSFDQQNNSKPKDYGNDYETQRSSEEGHRLLGDQSSQLNSTSLSEVSGPSSNSQEAHKFSGNDQIFLNLLHQEISKVESFFQSKETELTDEVRALIEEIEKIENQDFLSIPEASSESENEAVGGRGGRRKSTEGEAEEEDDSEEEHSNQADDNQQNRSSKFKFSLNRDQLLRSATTWGILPIIGGGNSSSSRSLQKQSKRLPSAGKSKSDPSQPEPDRDLINVQAGQESDVEILRTSVIKSARESSETNPRQSHDLSRNRTGGGRGRRGSASRANSSSNNNNGKWLQRYSSRIRGSLSNGRPSLDSDKPSLNPPELIEFWTSNIDVVRDSRIFFKRRLTQSFINLNALKAYIELNFTAFRKIVKKYDKVFKSSLSPYFMDEVLGKRSKTFEPSTRARVQALIDSLYPVYSRMVTQGDDEMCKRQLEANLREQLVWERNTVWREMIGLERKGWATNVNNVSINKPLVRDPVGFDDDQMSSFAVKDERPKLWRILGSIISPRFWLRIIRNYSVFWFLVATAFALGVMRWSWFENEVERNCLCLLVFVIVLWSTEALPLFATGLFVPLLAVVLRVIKDDNQQRMNSVQATAFLFGHMLSPTIFLLIGAFTLAAVLSKHNIDKIMASKLLGLAGNSPRAILLSYMAVTCFSSMWISNVAAPVLSYSLAQPILRTVPTKSPYTRALVLGIALSANIGGQASPISSPQNLICLEYMNPAPSWLVWFIVAIPICTLSVLGVWMFLVWGYERSFEYPDEDRLGSVEEQMMDRLPQRSSTRVINEPILFIKSVPSSKEPLSFIQWFILSIGLITVLLWCFEKKIEAIFGDMGVIALIPMIIYFGMGFLSKSDFDNFPWSIVILAMSGIALGKTVLASGLLNQIDSIVLRLIDGFSLWPISIIFGFIVLVIATFISHTVAAVLFIPVASEVGNSLVKSDGIIGGHGNLLIMITTLICSNGMGLPVSSFPNQTASNLEDEIGIRYLSSNDFLKFGIGSSLICLMIVISVGYLIMYLIGF